MALEAKVLLLKIEDKKGITPGSINSKSQDYETESRFSNQWKVAGMAHEWGYNIETR